MNEKQGVYNIIKLPLNQDINAVNMAVAHLLREGWKFLEVTNESISLNRCWEWEPSKGEEIVPRPLMNCKSCHNTGWIDSDGVCGNCDIGKAVQKMREVVESLEKKLNDSELCAKNQKSRAESALINGRRLIAEGEDRITTLETEIKTSEKVSGTFWEALKKLNLKELRVVDPGSHFTDHIAALEARLK